MDLEKFDTGRDIQELLAIRDDIERLSVLSRPNDGLTPKLDLFDIGDSYQAVIEVPGVPQENIEVALQGRSLTVAGLRESVGDDVTILNCERPSGPFERTVELPGEVVEENVTAHLREGLLVLMLPKA